MESGGNAWDIVIFGIYSYLIYDVIAHWSDYEDCHSPIQVFLLLTYCSILVHRIIIGLKSRPNLPWLIKKCVNITFYWIMNPLFLYITVQGIIWQVQNNTYTPSCIPESRVPWMIWWWVAILVLVDLLLIMITVVKLISWWRRFIFRRRVHRLMSGSGDLNQLLNNISHGSMNAALNDEVGLELTDLERIPKERFLKSLTNIFQQDSCPICYEDYQNDATIITLPGCEHVFHPHCINNWLLRNPLCPICRSNVRNNLVASMNKEDAQTETTIDVSL